MSSLPQSVLEIVLVAAFGVVYLYSLLLLFSRGRPRQLDMLPDRRHAQWRRRTLVRMLVGFCVVFVLLPFLGYARRHSIASIYNNPRQWISPRLVADRQYANFAWRFGEHDSVVVSWPGCTIDDPRLPKFAAEVENPADPARRAACERYFGQVLTGSGVVDGLTGKPLDLTRAEAADRLRGVLVGSDGHSSCAIVGMKEVATIERDVAVNLLLDIAAEVCQLPREEFVMGGAPVDGLMIDRQSRIAADSYSLPSNLLVLLLTLICLRSWRLTVIVYGLGMFGQLVTLGLVYWGGYQLNAIFLVMPPLLLVLTVSAGVHLVNYYHDEVRRGGGGDGDSITRRAIAKGWLPCLMAAATTVVGLLSLLVSESPPIAQFGAISAMAIVLVVALLFLMLPGAMEFWSRGRPADPAPLGIGGWADAFFNRLATVIVGPARHLVIFVCLAAMVVAGYGLTRMEISVSIRSLFQAESDVVRRYRWLEETIGPLVPIETVVRIGKDADLPMLEQVRLVQRVHAAVTQIGQVDGVISAATFLPDLQSESASTLQEAGISLRDAARFQRRIQQLQFVDETRQAQYWRITARVSTLVDIDYGQFLKEVGGQVEPVLSEARQRLGTHTITASFTGPMPLTYQAQRSLLDDLLKSFVTALVLIVVMMMIYLQSFRAGLVAMIPNLFPTVLLFGLTSLWGMPVNIGSVMTASVALGIAVDDTLHYVTWFRRELSATGSRREAVCRAYGHCAKAMVQSTLICGLGFLVYTLSPFVPTHQFALMMLMLLLAALAGDLLLLPALLVGPMGRWLESRATDASELGHRTFARGPELAPGSAGGQMSPADSVRHDSSLDSAMESPGRAGG